MNRETVIGIGPQRPMAMSLFIFKLLCLLCSGCFAQSVGPPIVNVKNGTIEGTIMTSRNGREIMAFRGIPYAKPPLGRLRFEPPEPAVAWTGVRSAKVEGNDCPQRNIFRHEKEITGDEDCLYINVYTPSLASNKTDASRTYYPVMIYIHGGSFIIGSSHSSLYGPKFLLDHDVVLVTLNYRLGPLGFLSTEDIASRGNQGMKDQVQAIRWVHENIAVFMGDVNRITIFGHSGGSMSVHYIMMSPLAKNLFHRAISQSGTALCPATLTRPGNAKKKAVKLGKLLDCPTEDSSAMVECLRQKTAEDIIATDGAYTVFDYCPIVPFGLVIESDHPGAFIKEEPVDSLKSGNMTDIPWMVGLVSHEGSFRVTDIFGWKEEKYDRRLNDEFMEIAPISLLYVDKCPKKSMDNVTKSIRKFYFNDEKINASQKGNLIDLYTDVWFYIGVDNSIRYHLEALSSPMYYYFFTYGGSSSFADKFENTEYDYGVSHGDELQYLFPIGETAFPKIQFSNEDIRMVELMTTLWANFARSGNPTPEKTSGIPVKWKPVRSSRLEYLHIGDSANLHMADNLFPDRVNFWSSMHKIMQSKDTDRHSRDEL